MIYFASSVFISAFLLFQIQPMIAKLLLPWFGGTPAVWSTVLLFFQLLLISGYAYAYWLIGKVTPHRQRIIHAITLSSALVLICTLSILWPSAVTPAANWKPHTVEFPIWHIFIVLTVCVGLPYFILATNAPLMQAWFSNNYPKRSPYRLYVLSNMGSLLALISYPFVIEPLLSMRWQGRVWSAGFAGFILLALYITLRGRHWPAAPAILSAKIATSVKPRLNSQLLWIALSACASIMLLATTNQITQEIAAMPFLWVLPLVIYLLSFIFTFNGENWYNRELFVFLLLVCSIEFACVITTRAELMIEIGAYSLLLFACCMICNGELYRLRPNTQQLTRFYLLIALGGALGGIFVTLIAPLIFTGYWELEIGIALCWLLLTTLVLLYPTPLKKIPLVAYQSAMLTITLIVCAFLLHFALNTAAHNRLSIRNFYGVLHIRELFVANPQLHSYILNHGVTTHGMEFIAPEKSHQPTAYYFARSGIALAITQHTRHDQGLRVGVLGLGSGTLAAYGQPQDTYRFYEINPAIIAIAKGQGGYFHFLQNSAANITIVLGDARLSLEKELATGQKQHFDILVLDTFSSDSIPLHLLTKEAFAVYLAHLAADGVLAVHISNKNLDLQPVVWQLAHFYHLAAIKIIANSGEFQVYSNWVLLSHNRAELAKLVDFGPAQWLTPANNKPVRLWTDDYSNLFQLLK